MRGKNIILGVTGGIAAYKAADLCSKLTAKEAHVHVIMTDHAVEFIQPLTFQALSHNPVRTKLFHSDTAYPHLDTSAQADLMIIAPATANCIAKAAHGLADDILSTVLLSCTCPVMMCPAMNVRMWRNRIVQKNIQQLQELKYEIVGPERGRLACGDDGIGRMASVDAILAKAGELLA